MYNNVEVCFAWNNNNVYNNNEYLYELDKWNKCFYFVRLHKITNRMENYHFYKQSLTAEAFISTYKKLNDATHYCACIN